MKCPVPVKLLATDLQYCTMAGCSALWQSAVHYGSLQCTMAGNTKEREQGREQHTGEFGSDSVPHVLFTVGWHPCLHVDQDAGLVG